MSVDLLAHSADLPETVDVVAAQEAVRDEIETEMARICGWLNVAHAQLVEVTARALETGIWRGAGIRSPEHWLSLQAGLSAERARKIVVLARRSAELPVTIKSLSDVSSRSTR